MKVKKLIEEATWVVNAFDQANTAQAIQRLGSRGEILRDAIADLRAILNEDKQKTILTQEEAHPKAAFGPIGIPVVI